MITHYQAYPFGYSAIKHPRSDVRTMGSEKGNPIDILEVKYTFY
jgi:hypothetical protein